MSPWLGRAATRCVWKTTVIILHHVFTKNKVLFILLYNTRIHCRIHAVLNFSSVNCQPDFFPMRMRIVLCESENRQQHKRIDTDVELIGIRGRESTMAGDLSKFSLVVSTLKIKSFFKVFSLLWIYLALFWKTQIPRVHGLIFEIRTSISFFFYWIEWKLWIAIE